MRKEVICEKCKQPIIFRVELVTIFIVFIIKPFHESCYSRQLKGSYSAMFMDGIPVNSILWTTNTIIGTPIGILFFTFAPEDIHLLGFLFLIPLFYRILSYVLYERHLKKH